MGPPEVTGRAFRRTGAVAFIGLATDLAHKNPQNYIGRESINSPFIAAGDHNVGGTL